MLARSIARILRLESLVSGFITWALADAALIKLPASAPVSETLEVFAPSSAEKFG